MRNNPDDLANQLVDKVKNYLQEEAFITGRLIPRKVREVTFPHKKTVSSLCMYSARDGILVGRKKLAEKLLNQIKKWEEVDV
jgi:hypothetical protein